LLGIAIGVLIALIGFWTLQGVIEKFGKQSSTGIEGVDITSQSRESEIEEKEKYPYLGKLDSALTNLEGLIELRYNYSIFIWSYDGTIRYTPKIKVTNLSNKTITALKVRWFVTDANSTFRNRIGDADTELLQVWQQEGKMLSIKPGQILYREDLFSMELNPFIPEGISIDNVRIEIVITELQLS
jgi:hypothetical protein